MEKIGVIGAGITGLFSALNLALDGYDVTLFDRDYILSGTSGKFHGMLHSGSRYSVNDNESAKECIQENNLLSSTASNFIKNTGGYYLALNDEEAEYGSKLLAKNRENGIPTKELSVKEMLKIEPNINKNIVRAFSVPDKVIYAHPFAAAVAVEASIHGTHLKFKSEVLGAKINNNSVESIRYSSKNKVIEEKFDYIINTTGPWAGNLLKSFGIGNFEVMPTLGYMASYDYLFSNAILNRMREPSDGDILLPYGTMSVAGTVAIISEDVENNEIDPEDLDTMLSEVSEMVPSLSGHTYKKLYSSMRPLIKEDYARATRDFKIYRNLDNLYSIIGGKFTTSRLMGEAVSRKLSEITGTHSQNTSKIILNDTFDKFIKMHKSDLNTGFMNYISSYGNSMDYAYLNQLESAFILNEAIRLGD
ncbi:FAD-dependent oxidoreductase [Ferroplasma sp.]|uniref:FAD-dependent oxidoreductase n=1 Tax=Ferroplasma sp. TaxID=2591003 RepID=UPI00307DE056